MRHYILVALVAALAALPFSLSAFSLSPSSWFVGDAVSAMGRTHDRSHDVTSNGVTKVQMQYLYKDDMLVTDVDLSQSVTTNVYTKDETDEMTNLLAGADAALSRRVADNWSSIVLLELADRHLAFSNRIALVRVDGVQSNLTLTASAVADLASKVPYSAPYSAYSSLCLEPPVVRVSTDNGVGFCVRGSDGRYYDSREIAERGATPAFSVSTLYGRSFTPEYLNSNVSVAVWESGFTLSADNIDRRLRDVCIVTGYPYVYGEAATVRDLVYDLLTVDYSLWRDGSGVIGHEGSFMDLSSLASVAARGTAYAMRAHESAAQLRYDTRFSDDNRAFVNGVRMVSPSVAVVTPTNDTRVAGKAADAMATGIALATRYTKAEVDAKDAATLQAAKDYTDQHGGGGAVQSVNGKTGAVVLDAAAIPYTGNESYEQVADVEKGLDYAIYTADEAKTEATGRPTYDDLDGYLPLSGGTMTGNLKLHGEEGEDFSFEAMHGGEYGGYSTRYLFGKIVMNTPGGGELYFPEGGGTFALTSDISETNQAFSRAVMGVASHTNAAFAAEVLAVQVSSLSTNITAEVYIAATNAWASLGIDPALIPQSGTLGTVGGLIIALAAAVYFLKRKTSLLESDGTASEAFATDLLGKPITKGAITASLADPFVAKTSGSYAEGDPVTYDGKLYKRSTEPGDDTSWVSSHWMETTVATLWNNADTTSYGGQN